MIRYVGDFSAVFAEKSPTEGIKPAAAHCGAFIWRVRDHLVLRAKLGPHRYVGNRFALDRMTSDSGRRAIRSANVTCVSQVTTRDLQRQRDRECAGPGQAALAFVGMPPKRMNREEFFAKLSPLDEDGLRKVLWNVYWRGPAPLRARIEGELDPTEHDRRKRAAAQPADPDWVLYEVREFAELARAGAYIAGDRRVSPKERTRWRVTFRRLAADAQSALRAQDAGSAEEALALIIDLACEMRDRSYFRSEDPVEAARFVVSDAAAMLWESMQDRHGAQIVAERAAEQLIRWESRHGWTRGWGQIHKKETPLARVLARMLRVPDLWTVIADRYLDALDQLARAEAAKPKSRRPWAYPDADYVRRHRTGELAEWHELLLDRLAGSEAEDRLDRLVSHPALAGPELAFLRARLADQRGDLDGARKLVQDCLQDLPGHQGFASFAAKIGADLPPSARELADQRSQWEAVRAAGPGPE